MFGKMIFLTRYLTNTDENLPVSIVVGRLVKCRKITVQRLPTSAIRCPDHDGATGQTTSNRAIPYRTVIPGFEVVPAVTRPTEILSK